MDSLTTMNVDDLARVPVIPLTMAESDKAYNHEILIDDETKQIFIHIDGEFYNVTASIEKITNAVFENLKHAFANDMDFLRELFSTELAGIAIGEAKIRLDNGEIRTLKDILQRNVNNIELIFKNMVYKNQKINGHSLSGDITLNANDVHARSDTWLPTPEDIHASRDNHKHDDTYVKLTDKGVPNGVPLLDASGKIPDTMLYAQGGLVAQATPPDNTKLGWIDTNNNNILKFYDGSKWTTVNATWG